MANDDQVVWEEGMMLTPQHFQQWQRWVGAELRDRSRASLAFPWGFTDWELDVRALSGGQLAVSRVAGMLLDGVAFACPDRDPTPPARSIAEHFPAQQQDLMAYLALPTPAEGAPRYGDVAAAVPLVRRRLRVADEVRPEADREIATARLNLSLRFHGESMVGYQVLPIARLVRSGAGYALAGDFIPPALTIAAAPVLGSILRQVTGMLTQKWSELAGKRRGGGGMAEAAGLLLLHTVADSLPQLRHGLQHGRVPPELAYLQLARLTAQLCCFHGRLGAADVPLYDHGDPGACFGVLAKMLQELLGEAAPSRCSELPMERQGDWMYSAKIPSPGMLQGGRLFLAVKADAPEEDVQTRFPSLAKVSSKDKIQELLIRAVSGLPLRVVPQPPPAIPVQAGRSYFSLEPGGEHWEAIAASLTLAIHVSPGLGPVSLELLAVKE